MRSLRPKLSNQSVVSHFLFRFIAIGLFLKKSIAVCFFLFFISFFQAQAAAEEDLRQQIVKEELNLKNLQEDQKSILSSLKQVDSKENEIKETLKFILENQIKTQKELIQIEKGVLQTNAIIKFTEQTIKNYKLNLEELDKKLSKQIARLYRLQKINDFSYLPNADFLVNYQRNQFFLGKIAKHEMRLFHRYEQLLEEKKHKAEQLEIQKSKLLELQNQKKSTYESLVFDQSQQALYLDYLTQEKESNRRQLKEIEERFDSVNNSINFLRRQQTEQEEVKKNKAVFSQGLEENKGKLLNPIEGELIKAFKAESDRKELNKFKYGIILKPSQDTKTTKAIQAGNVALSGRLKGYGNIIIIDHGQSSYSVYGLIKKRFVEKGDKVLTGTEIGSLFEKYTDGDGLFYFEVRYRNIPVDPNKWLAHPYQTN